MCIDASHLEKSIFVFITLTFSTAVILLWSLSYWDIIPLQGKLKVVVQWFRLWTTDQKDRGSNSSTFMLPLSDPWVLLFCALLCLLPWEGCPWEQQYKHQWRNLCPLLQNKRSMGRRWICVFNILLYVVQHCYGLSWKEEMETFELLVLKRGPLQNGNVHL